MKFIFLFFFLSLSAFAAGLPFEASYIIGHTVNGDNAASTGNWAVYGSAGNLSLQSNAGSTPGYIQSTDGSAWNVGSPNALAAAVAAYATQSESPPAAFYMAIDGSSPLANSTPGIGIDVYGSHGVLVLAGTDGTVATPNYLSSGNGLGSIVFATWGGFTAEDTTGAEIRAIAAENQSASSVGTQLVLQSTPNGSSAKLNSLVLQGLQVGIPGYTTYTQQASAPTPTAGADNFYFQSSNGQPVWQDSTGSVHSFYAQTAANPTGTYTVLTSDGILLCTGTTTLTLPKSLTNAGKSYTIFAYTSDTVTINAQGTDIIVEGSSQTSSTTITTFGQSLQISSVGGLTNPDLWIVTARYN